MLLEDQINFVSRTPNVRLIMYMLSLKRTGGKHLITNYHNITNP